MEYRFVLARHHEPLSLGMWWWLILHATAYAVIFARPHRVQHAVSFAVFNMTAFLPIYIIEFEYEIIIVFNTFVLLTLLIWECFTMLAYLL